MYEFSFDGKTHLFEKDESDKGKYIVFACAKNEDDYIREWVDHNLEIGFDKVIIADNNDDPSILAGILSEQISNGTVQIFKCSGLKGFQLYIYDMFLSESNYKWCAYFDCDEFLELSQHKSVKDFLSIIKEDCVLINWMVFGGGENYLKKDGTLRERFNEPVGPSPLFKENFYVKPIVRSGRQFLGFKTTHSPTPKYIASYNLGGYAHADFQSHVYAPPRYKYAYIRHYYTKSFEEWIHNKVKRGWPDQMPDLLKAENYFILQNKEKFPVEKYIKGLFIDNYALDRGKKTLERIMNEYSFVLFKSTEKNIYSLILEVFYVLKNFTGKRLVVQGEFVDDAAYASMLEYAILTGNEISYVFNDSEIGNVISKYGGENTFYWLNCL